MRQRASGSAAVIVVIVLAGCAFAAANLAVLLMATHGAVDVALLAQSYQQCPLCVCYLVAAPLVFALLAAVLCRSATSAAPPVAAKETEKPTAPAAPSPAAALRLLALLQQEGRFIDFLQEDIDSYSDAQVGAAVRSIHAGCRKALHERIELQRIFTQEEGTEVVVDKGYDPAGVRLTGNVAGQPPFRGTLQHGGWRAARVSLPQSPADADATVLAPAEVEIP